MKYTYSLAFLAIACLTSQNVTAASTAKEFAKILKRNVSTCPISTLEALGLEVNASKNILNMDKIHAENAHKERMAKIYSKLSNTVSQETPNIVKAGISKILALSAALFAAGYYSGMNHQEIEKGFDKQVKPALLQARPAILLEKISLLTEEKVKDTLNTCKAQAIDIFKKVALKNQETTESKATETNEDKN